MQPATMADCIFFLRGRKNKNYFILSHICRTVKIQRHNKKPAIAQISRESRVLSLVEVRGVGPLSENTSSGTSPGADDSFHSLILA